MSLDLSLSSPGPHGDLRRLVLQQGQPYRSLNLPKSEVAKLRGLIKALPLTMKRGWCFSDALVLIRADSRLRYVEGYILPRRRSYIEAHAWVTLDGAVIDPHNKTFGRVPKGTSYRGIEFDSAAVEQNAWRLDLGMGMVPATLFPERVPTGRQGRLTVYA